MKCLTSDLLALAMLLVGLPSASAQPRESRGWNFDERYYWEGKLAEAARERTKMCSVYVPNAWRDTFAAPHSWQWNDCRDFAVAMGATHIHFVYLFEEERPKFSFGGLGDLPEPNCGWGRRRR